MSVKSWTEAIAKAATSWNPALHPRGRDGKFIEVGDLVAVFDGPGGPQIKTGKVKAGYFAPDGRMFIGVDSGDGKVEWYRPKQIEQVHAKATLPPAQPLPEAGGKIESIQWDAGPMAEVGYTTSGGTKFTAPPGTKYVAEAPYPTVFTDSGGHEFAPSAVIKTEDGKYYGVDKSGKVLELDPDLNSTPYMETVLGLNQGPTDGAWPAVHPDPELAPLSTPEPPASLAEAATPEAGKLPTSVGTHTAVAVYEVPDPPAILYSTPSGAKYSVVSGVDVYEVKDGQSASLGGQPNSAVYQIGDEWFGVHSTTGEVISLGKSTYLGSIVANEDVWAKATPANPKPDPVELPVDVTVMTPSNDGIYPHVLEKSTGQWVHTWAIFKDKEGKTHGVSLDGKVFEVSEADQSVNDPGWNWTAVTPAKTKAAKSKADLAAASKIKLPKGKSPADVIGMIRTSAENKGLSEAEVSTIASLIDSALNAGSYSEGKKSLAKAMTMAKLGGKQRARYNTLLQMHHGVGMEHAASIADPDAPAVPAKPGGMPKVSPKLPPSGTGAKIMGLQPGKQWVQAGGSSAQQAKGNVQQQIVARMKGLPVEKFAALFESPNYSVSPMHKELVELWRSLQSGGTLDGKKLKKIDGSWSVGGYGGQPATKESLEQAIRETAINTMIHLWAQTSNDSNARSQAMQRAARVEFSLEDTFDWPMSASLQASTDSEFALYEEVFRRFLRAMYENTQEALKAEGVTHVRLRRGTTGLPSSYTWSKGSSRQVSLCPMSSFSSNQQTAQSFAGSGGVVLDCYVPIERIIGSARTGFGCRSEYEYVVLGGTDEYVRHS